VYVSTTGVYGNRHGDYVDETTTPLATSARSKRRLDAESVLRHWAVHQGISLSILRVPGIYGPQRLPIERLQANTPALNSKEDAYSNHIHADDLARLVLGALFIGKPQRIVNACDSSEQKMGDYFDEVATALNLPKPKRLSREEVRSAVSPMLWSFMSESRRVRNTRLPELKRPLLYPTVAHYLKTLKEK
jgi:nucleoside-diphosphate-sugar epimerase